MFRQWQQKFTTALGQVRAEYEEIVHKLAREIDLGREMENILTMLGREYGGVFVEASQALWKVLIDEAEAEAYEKIKTIPPGQGIEAYGVGYRWFTDVSGL